MSLINIQRAIQPYVHSLIEHPIYRHIDSLESISRFMQYHVFAVWDFMSLLKSLQLAMTCCTLPWIPKPNPTIARLINHIVTEEETDEDINGQACSHFELYCQAMQQAGANLEPINQLIEQLQHGMKIEEFLKTDNLPTPVNRFLSFTFSLIASQKHHAIASAFTFGRENVIPEMFIKIVRQLNKKNPEKLDLFQYYLDRHILLDGEDHGPKALKMVELLCKDNPIYWQEAEEAAIQSLKYRIELWDYIAFTLK